MPQSPGESEGSPREIAQSGLGAEALAEVASSQLIRAVDARDRIMISLAIDALVRALQSLPVDHPLKGKYMSFLASAYHNSFEITNSIDDLRSAVNWGERSLSATPAGHPGRTIALHMLAESYLRRFEHTDDPADLDAAINSGDGARSVNDYTGRSAVQTLLSKAYWMRFVRDNDVADLRTSTERGEEAVGAYSSSEAVPVETLMGLGLTHLAQFNIDGDPATAQKGIERIEAAFASKSASNSTRLDSDWIVTVASLMLFGCSGTVKHLQQVEAQANRFVGSVDAEHPKRYRGVCLASVVREILDHDDLQHWKHPSDRARGGEYSLGVDDRRGVIADLIQLGAGLARGRRPDDGGEVLIRSAVDASSIGDSVLAFRSLRMLFDVRQVVSKRQLRRIQTSLRVAVRRGDDGAALAEGLNHLGSYLRERSRFSESVRVLAWAGNFARRAGRLDIEAESLTNQGMTLRKWGKRWPAIYLLKVGVNAANDSGDAETEAMALYDLGGALSEVKDWRQRKAERRAVEAYSRAAELYAHLGNVKGQIGALNNMGIIEGSLKRYDDAISTLRNAATIARSHGMFGLESGVLWNLRTYLNAAGYADAAEVARVRSETAMDLFRRSPLR